MSEPSEPLDLIDFFDEFIQDFIRSMKVAKRPFANPEVIYFNSKEDSIEYIPIMIHVNYDVKDVHNVVLNIIKGLGKMAKTNKNTIGIAYWLCIQIQKHKSFKIAKFIYILYSKFHPQPLEERYYELKYSLDYGFELSVDIIDDGIIEIDYIINPFSD
jgi:hypothetical protein